MLALQTLLLLAGPRPPEPPVQIMTELGPATSLRHIDGDRYEVMVGDEIAGEVWTSVENIPALGLEPPPRIGGNYLVIGAGQKVGRRVGKRRRRR